MAKDGQKTVYTPIFRASYCHIFTPTQNDEGKDVWSVMMIFEPDADLEPMKDLCRAAKLKKFGANATGKFKSPFRKGDDEEFDLSKNPEYKGKIIVAARSYGQPVGVVDRNKRPITSENDFYSGCYAIASVSAYGYDRKGNKGMAIGLNNIMKIRDGEPLISRISAEDDFAELDTSEFGEDNSDMFGDIDDL